MSIGRRMFHNLRAYLKKTVSTACGRSMDLASSKVELMGYRSLRFSWTEIQPILACSQTLCCAISTGPCIEGIAVSYRTER
jgi:hypothetical protein